MSSTFATLTQFLSGECEIDSRRLQGWSDGGDRGVGKANRQCIPSPCSRFATLANAYEREERLALSY
jgi:hypothetical protein